MKINAEQTARNILRELYTNTFQLRRLFSRNSDVFVAEFLNGDEPVLLKLPKNNEGEFLREQRIADQLESAGIPVPPIYYTQENQPLGVNYTIQKYIHGPNLGQVIEWNDERTEQIFNNLGQLTSQIAAIAFSSVPDALLSETTQEHELQWWEDFMGFVNRHRGTSPLLWQLYHAARGIMLVPPHHFGHRDGMQIVTDGSEIYLVDMGAAGANWADADFARLLYRGTVRYNGEAFEKWRRSVQMAYYAGRRVSDADVERVIILMVYYALRDAGMAAGEGKTVEVERLYDYAKFFVTDVKSWFGR